VGIFVGSYVVGSFIVGLLVVGFVVGSFVVSVGFVVLLIEGDAVGL
jgi:hypothetical protein